MISITMFSCTAMEVSTLEEASPHSLLLLTLLPCELPCECDGPCTKYPGLSLL